MGKTQQDNIATVLAWHEAINAGDIDLALAVSAPGIVVGGPKGDAHGHAILAEWIRHAGIRLDPIAIHPVGESIIVEELAIWEGNPETSAEAAPIEVASVFTMLDGLVASVHRFDSLDEATCSLQSAR